MNAHTNASTNGADNDAIEGVWKTKDKSYSPRFNCVLKKNSYGDLRNTIRQ